MSGWTLEGDRGDYPVGLDCLGAGDRPKLFGRGSRAALVGLTPEAAVTIVGARRPTGYGVRIAETLAADLAHAGVTVVSGMAIGIDAAAHRGALAGGGTTIAVLAGGPDVVYPARHRSLYGRILEAGAAISERPPGAGPRKHDFPARNRIMAALAKVVVVVEAARPSGSLISARHAQELGRELGAVPGQVGVRVAEGTNWLLKECHAQLIRDAQDVLDLLAGVGAIRLVRTGPELDPGLDGALEAVERGAATPDEVARDAGLDPGAAAIALARLELLGYLGSDTLGAYAPTGLERPG